MVFYVNFYYERIGINIGSTKWTDHPKKMKNLKSEMDGYKPMSTKWMDHLRRMKDLKSEMNG